MEYFTYVLFRFAHTLVGIVWIGLLYYFNFVQTEYLKEAEPDAKSDVLKKLAPNALWWFRWAAFFTFLTGLYMLYVLQTGASLMIILGALMGTIMMLNVWGIIWRNQKIVIGLKEGDAAVAGAKAGLASRTNTLFSIPMLYFMVFSHLSSFPADGPPACASLPPALESERALPLALRRPLRRLRRPERWPRPGAPPPPTFLGTCRRR